MPADSESSDAPLPPRERGVREGVVVLAIAVVSMLVFAPAMSGGFIFDDRKLILENTYIHSFEWWWRWFSTNFWDANAELRRFSPRLTYYRPGVTVTYAVDWFLSGGSPLFFHVTNLLLHAAVGVLAYRALRRWVVDRGPAVLFAVWFAVHPTKAESVAWISGRTDVLCMLMMLVALEGTALRLAKRRGGLVLEVLGTLAAYLTKETAIVLSALLFVEHWVHSGRGPISVGFCTRVGSRLLPQAILAGAYLGARAIWLPVKGTAQLSFDFSPFEYLGSVLETLGRSAALVFVPHRLTIQQGLVFPGLTGHINLTPSYVVLGGVAALALLLGVWWSARKHAGVFVGLMFFCVAYLPTSNVVQTRMPTLLSERFLYIPLLGLALAGAFVLARHRQAWLRVLVVVATLGHATVAATRSHDFSDERTFWARELRINPLSLEAHRSMVLFATEDHRYSDALRHFSEAYVAVQRTYPGTRMVLELALDAVELMIYLTPDAPREHVDAIARFYEDAMIASDILPPSDGIKPRVARLKLPQLTLEQDLINLSIPETRERNRRRLLIGYATLQSRLGSDEDAVRFADLAVLACTDCVPVVIDAARIHARAGNYPRAFGLLIELSKITRLSQLFDATERIQQAAALHSQSQNTAGPPGLLARAAEFAALDAYGRAYDVLAPHREAIAPERELAVQFGELAWRAGHFAVSREVLARHLPVREVDATTHLWNEKMGWN